MKKNIKNIIIIIIFIYLLVNVLMNKELVFDSFKQSTNILINNLAPSLFPMFIISEILINYNFGTYLTIILGKFINKYLKISSNCFLLLILSILSGFPSNAKNIRTMYENKEINKEEASLLLTFTHFSNPLFILGVITSFLNNNQTLSIIILISHYFPNFIILILMRKKLTINNSNIKPNYKLNFPKVLMSAISNSVSTLLMILGTLSFFLILSEILINSLNVNTATKLIIKATLEVTQGLSYLSSLNINNIYKVILSSMFLSFGGFCIHFQIISQINDTDISYSPFFIFRVFHMILSGIISFIIYTLYFSLFT